MPYKVEQSQRIFRLQRSLRAKQRALQQLEQERARLHLREFLLSATCEVRFRTKKATCQLYCERPPAVAACFCTSLNSSHSQLLVLLMAMLCLLVPDVVQHNGVPKYAGT